MASKERRNNPHSKSAGGTQQARRTWNAGYEAAVYNRELEGSEGAVQHPECDSCNHVNRRQYNLKVMFTLEEPVTALPLSSAQLAEQIADALPKEWWIGNNVAEWGTVAIFPLTKHGVLCGTPRRQAE
jgi:hypothetical protein